MPEPKKYEDIEYNGRPARKYPDGSIRDEKGHWLELHPAAIPADSERGLAMVNRKLERKRERIQAGALAAVRDKLPDKFDGLGDDWVEAIAEAVTYKALDRLDPKQVDAARFLLQETGLSEPKQVQNMPHEAVTDIIRELAAFAGAIVAQNGIDNSNYRKHDTPDTIDATFTDTSNEASNEGDDPSGDAQGTG